MKRAGHRQRERLDRRVERVPVLGHHLVGAAHGADRRGNAGAARVLEPLAGLHNDILWAALWIVSIGAAFTALRRSRNLIRAMKGRV